MVLVDDCTSSLSQKRGCSRIPKVPELALYSRTDQLSHLQQAVLRLDPNAFLTGRAGAWVSSDLFALQPAQSTAGRSLQASMACLQGLVQWEASPALHRQKLRLYLWSYLTLSPRHALSAVCCQKNC